jgi:hypothetical protein
MRSTVRDSVGPNGLPLLLYHSFLSFTDEHHRLIRAALPTRKTFFHDLRALTRYLLFAYLDALMDFMR